MKEIFQYWWNKGNKQISLISYKKSWSTNGTGRIWRIRTNGAKRKNGDKCFDFHIELGYLVFNYTNFNLQESNFQMILTNITNLGNTENLKKLV